MLDGKRGTNVSLDKRLKYDPDIVLPRIRKKTYRHENHVKESIKDIMDMFRGCTHWPVGASGTSRRTVDRMACYRGYFLAIEAKYGKNKPTELQRKFLTDIELSGGFSICIDEKNIIDLYHSMIIISELPFGGSYEPIPFGITDITATANTYRDLDKQVR